MKGCTYTSCTKKIIAHHIENVAPNPSVLGIEVSVVLHISSFSMGIGRFAFFLVQNPGE